MTGVQTCALPIYTNSPVGVYPIVVSQGTLSATNYSFSLTNGSLAVTAANREGGMAFHLMLNAYWEALDFELPAAGVDGEGQWRRWIDTAQDTPNDIVAWHDAPPVPGPTYRLEPRSVVVLFTHGR